MNAADMTFGIEIECMIPVANAPTVGGYHRGYQVADLPMGWNAQSDCSIQALPGYRAVEIVSPILRGAEGIEQVIAVVRQLKQWGAKVNASCGFHVHVGANFRTNKRALINLIHLVGKFEPALFAITGSKQRALNHFCRPVKAQYETIRKNPTDEALRRLNRYCSLNLTNLVNGRETVEFRVFAGTLNLNKILGYIQVCLGLAENAHAMTRAAKYGCTNARHQTPEGIVYRMLRNFNWYSEKKMGNRQYGVLKADSIEDIKAEFKRLAKKFGA